MCLPDWTIAPGLTSETQRPYLMDLIGPAALRFRQCGIFQFRTGSKQQTQCFHSIKARRKNFPKKPTVAKLTLKFSQTICSGKDEGS
jgi:hypothetical protein